MKSLPDGRNTPAARRAEADFPSIAGRAAHAESEAEPDGVGPGRELRALALAAGGVFFARP